MNKNEFRVAHNNDVEFLLEGEVYYQRYLDLIIDARVSIHLQTYIFKMDDFGLRVYSELCKAARRGVRVYLLIDSIGSSDFDEKYQYELKNAGVNFYKFNGIRFRWLGQWGRRLHHKLIVVDHTYAIVGGINVISSTYKSSASEKSTHQLDFAVYLKGMTSIDLAKYCQKTFSKAIDNTIDFANDLIDVDGLQKKIDTTQNIKVKIFVNDWLLRRWKISSEYSQMTKLAEKDIIIVNSYFFPRQKFLKQLCAAANRGVKVRLLLPKYSDWPKYVLASQYLYSYLLKNGVEIYQWKKSILHGKMATFDNNVSTIGSFNLNYTSYQQNLEMNVALFSREMTTAINNRLVDLILNGSERIDAKDFIEKASLSMRILRFFYYILLSIIANFSVGLTVPFKKHDRR